ncbi:hypothetical protein EGI22_17570 [Lacihabitans sp. LS3-19]|uniref:hypothetical protein n=1 Tax=Lacihabitans sp. LS3-19 TaxID=2487335 RepID=UPI0020CEB5C0|nr:hypothetical protein [Lacihabitans sp. LS3-19]MCP9769716.1 hypothetical protein [Lacihabitans sp. LS3-19]
MKKIFSNWILPAFLGLTAVLIIGSACNMGFGSINTQAATCDENLSDLKKITETIISKKLGKDSKMDLLIHEFTFTVPSPKTICKIGYQGNANLFAANLPYTIEIVKASNNSVIFTINQVFNATEMQYIPANVSLDASEKYIIRRKLPAGGYLNKIENTEGRAITNLNPGDFPFETSNYSIIGGQFYDTTPGPVANIYFPFIDIIFES